MGTSEGLPCGHQQVFENRPQTEGREKSKRTHDQNRGYQQACEQAAGHRERSRRFRNGLFPG